MKNIEQFKEQIEKIRTEVQQGIVEIMSNNNLSKTFVSTNRESYMLIIVTGKNGDITLSIDDGMDRINFKKFDVSEGIAIYENLAEKYLVA
jgi:hypothetical protein